MRFLAPTLAAALALLALAAPASAANPTSAPTSGDVPGVSRPYGPVSTGTSEARASASGGLERLIAPVRSCHGQLAADAEADAQERTMLCMTNFARRRSGLRALRPVGLLFRSAALKSRDILGCDRFDHSACGRDFTFWMRRVGYISGPCWRAAENIAYGTGPYATVRSIFHNWIHSTGHRENILGPSREIGVGLRIGTLEGNRGAHVWTQHFGSRC